MSIDLYEFGELYHDYSIFGAKNHQIKDVFSLNQKCKAPIIISYISMAVAKSKVNINDDVSFLELFCADAYYAMLALHLGATKSIGVDNNKIKQSGFSKSIAKKLGLKNFEFVLEDVHNADRLGKFDIVANVGGLYHIEDPVDVLARSYNMAKKYLIVQSVVSMRNNNPDYFEKPAPSWNWGNRFNKVSFDKMIKKFGWNIVDYHFNELIGNKNLNNRGSVYYLISCE